MGAVDVLACLLGSYQPTIRGKKWYCLLFINELSVSIVSVWRIHTSISFLLFLIVMVIVIRCVFVYVKLSKLNIAHLYQIINLVV